MAPSTPIAVPHDDHAAPPVTQLDAPRDAVETGLFEIVRKYLKTADAAWNTVTTMEEAQIDSLDLVELVFEIEDRFGVEINFNANDRPVGELTFGDVVAMIRAALAAKARAA